MIARIAGSAHGVVTRGELLAGGLTEAEIRTRVSRGALIVVHRGVYRAGHRAPSPEARYMAAVRACGDGALLSGRAAAYLFGLMRGHPPAPEVATLTERRIDGVVTKRLRRSARASTSFRGIPVTTVSGTLVDLAAVLDPTELARACHEAGVRFGTGPGDVLDALAHRRNSPGASTLRGVMCGDVRVTLSVLERRFLVVLAGASLPLPQTNVVAGTRRVDCRWPAHRLTVELDGYRYHSSRHAWEQDRRREREARARGDEFRRYTYSDVLEAPQLMLQELRLLLPAGCPAELSSDNGRTGRRPS